MLRMKFGGIKWFKISNLMFWITVITGLVWFADVIQHLNRRETVLSDGLKFNLDSILNGEVWRLVSFIFVPMTHKVIAVFLGLYALYYVGTKIERSIGETKLTLYYFLGVVACVIAGFLAGKTTVYFLNLTLFLVYAEKYSNCRVVFMFFFPMEARWFGYITAVLYVVGIFTSLVLKQFSDALTAVLVLIVYALFFGLNFIKEMIFRLKNYHGELKSKRSRYY